MSADGLPVRSLLEAVQAELVELSHYCARLEAELCASNARASAAEKLAGICKEVAGGLLWKIHRDDFQREVARAALEELVRDLKLRDLDERSVKLVSNVELALRAS